MNAGRWVALCPAGILR